MRLEKRRGPGRPPGPTEKGARTRKVLYETAINLMASQGYEETTMRDIAKAAGVSVGLVYRYFPSKRTIVLALYDTLSAEFAAHASELDVGTWRCRFLQATRGSLEVLGPNRLPLLALLPILVGDPHEGLFAPRTAFSRARVQRVFRDAVVGATDAPGRELAEVLARLLYLVHLCIVLWWLMDRSPGQRGTEGLVALVARSLPTVGILLYLKGLRSFAISFDRLFQDWLGNRRATASS